MTFLPIISGSRDSTHVPPPIRMSTPAGMRLSVIMENNNVNNVNNINNNTRIPKRSSMISFGKSSQTSGKEPSKTSIDEPNHGYSYSIFAEKADLPPRSSRRVRGCECFSRKGGWKRLLLFLGLFFITVIALVAGVVLGIRKHASKK
jgi:hypothetical protein